MIWLSEPHMTKTVEKFKFFKTTFEEEIQCHVYSYELIYDFEPTKNHLMPLKIIKAYISILFRPVSSDTSTPFL